MRYLLDHTVFFEANPWYIIPFIIMVATLVYCFTRIRKMKKEAMELRAKLSSDIADNAFNEPMMEHTVEDETPEAGASK